MRKARVIFTISRLEFHSRYYLFWLTKIKDLIAFIFPSQWPIKSILSVPLESSLWDCSHNEIQSAILPRLDLAPIFSQTQTSSKPSDGTHNHSYKPLKVMSAFLLGWYKHHLFCNSWKRKAIWMSRPVMTKRYGMTTELRPHFATWLLKHRLFPTLYS